MPSSRDHRHGQYALYSHSHNHSHLLLWLVIFLLFTEVM